MIVSVMSLGQNYVHFRKKRTQMLMADRSDSMIELQVVLFKVYTGHWVIANSCYSFFILLEFLIFQNKVTVKKRYF